MSKSALYITGAVFLALAIWRPVYAQQPGDSGANEAGALEEVTVTAQRREESIQDVSASITALDEVALEQSQ